MTIAAETSLAKVTITTDKRAIDVALPENSPVADLLPYILRHTGDGTADDGEGHGGWALRRPTGARLDARKTLGAQQVRDGEVLHLVPGHVQWPEPEYDDVVETIASGARRYGRSWGRDATRKCGLAFCCAILLGGALVSLLFEPPWLVPGVVLLAAAVVLTAAGAVVARTVPDARAGAVFAGCGLPYAFLGGFFVTAPSHAVPAGFESPQLLLGAVALVVFGVVGYIGIGALARLFAAAIVIGLLGAFGSLITGPMASDGAAALVLTAGIGMLPGYPLLAIRLGRLPVPALPQRSADLLADEEPPPTPDIFAAAARSDEILSGLLLGLSIVSVFCAAVLAANGETSRLIMLGVATAALLLRARLFPVPRHRIPLLVAGSLLAAILMGGNAAGAQSNGALALWLLTMVGIAGTVSFAGAVYSRKNPSPYLGRIADICDVLAILSLVPLACYITGFFAYVQGLMASIG